MTEIKLDSNSEAYKKYGTTLALLVLSRELDDRGVVQEDASIRYEESTRNRYLEFTNRQRLVVVRANHECVYRCEIDGTCAWAVCPDSVRHIMEKEIVKILNG